MCVYCVVDTTHGNDNNMSIYDKKRKEKRERKSLYSISLSYIINIYYIVHAFHCFFVNHFRTWYKVVVNLIKLMPILGGCQISNWFPLETNWIWHKRDHLFANSHDQRRWLGGKISYWRKFFTRIVIKMCRLVCWSSTHKTKYQKKRHFLSLCIRKKVSYVKIVMI